MANQSVFKGMGIKTFISAPASPWQNSFAERVIRSIREEMLNHMIVLNEGHLRRLLASYFSYYHEVRTHIGLNKDCPVSRPIQINCSNKIISTPVLGGLHRQYNRASV
jgi:transposase InsO family protein